jgi:hypothetical protein
MSLIMETGMRTALLVSSRDEKVASNLTSDHLVVRKLDYNNAAEEHNKCNGDKVTGVKKHHNNNDSGANHASSVAHNSERTQSELPNGNSPPPTAASVEPLPNPLFAASAPIPSVPTKSATALVSASAPIPAVPTKSALGLGLPLGLDRPLELKRAMSYSFSVTVHPTGFAADSKSPTKTMTKSLENDDWSVPPPSSALAYDPNAPSSPAAASEGLFFSCLAKLIDTMLDFTSFKHRSLEKSVAL